MAKDKSYQIVDVPVLFADSERPLGAAVRVVRTWKRSLRTESLILESAQVQQRHGLARKFPAVQLHQRDEDG